MSGEVHELPGSVALGMPVGRHVGETGVLRDTLLGLVEDALRTAALAVANGGVRSAHVDRVSVRIDFADPFDPDVSR